MGAFSTGKNMDLFEVASKLVEDIKPIDNNIRFQYGWPDYIRDFRTYMIAAPRRAGKTTTISRMAAERSALAYYKHRSTGAGGPIESESLYMLRGRSNLMGLKYECILLDEYKVIPDKVYLLIDEMARSGIMTNKFFILGLYTP